MISRTPRLVLRPLAFEDLDSLAALRADPDVMRLIGDGQTREKKDTEEGIRKSLLHWQQHNFGRWAVLSKEDATFLGSIELWRSEESGEVELGFLFGKPHWGQGLATESSRAILRYGFETLMLDRIISGVLTDHKASRHVLEKLGLTHDAHHPDNTPKWTVYALTLSEWTEGRTG